MEEQKTIQMFCANDQVEMAHSLDIDGNGEIVLTCSCGRFQKLPAGTDADGVRAFVEAHKAANEGQRSVESLEAEKAKLLEELTPIETPAV